MFLALCRREERLLAPSAARARHISQPLWRSATPRLSKHSVVHVPSQSVTTPLVAPVHSCCGRRDSSQPLRCYIAFSSRVCTRTSIMRSLAGRLTCLPLQPVNFQETHSALIQTAALGVCYPPPFSGRFGKLQTYSRPKEPR